MIWWAFPRPPINRVARDWEEFSARYHMSNNIVQPTLANDMLPALVFDLQRLLLTEF